MIDYDFYVNVYLGSTIPQKVFPGVAARATDSLAAICRRYRVSGEEIARKMALCAMAETLYNRKGREDTLSAATVGGVSVRYESNSLARQLLQQARIYLDIYRGVTQ